MQRNRGHAPLGIFLIVLGALFFLLNNDLLWFGWDAFWPIFPLLIGIFLLRVFFKRRKPRQLFAGLLMTQLGIFFFVFTTGAASWDAMEAAWPTFPLMIGIALLALSGVARDGSSAVVTGATLVGVALIGYLSSSGAIRDRISEPLTRLWPLALVLAGILIFMRGRRERSAAAGPPDTESTLPPAGGPKEPTG